MGKDGRYLSIIIIMINKVVNKTFNIFTRKGKYFEKII